jgi:hypothetical protein
MKETNDGPFGLKRIVTEGGTTFFRNTNGIFDEAGKKVFVTMGEVRRFERQQKEINELKAKKLGSEHKQGHQLDSEEQSNKRTPKDVE